MALLALSSMAPAQAERAPLLPKAAFQVASSCPLDPFVALDGRDLERRLRHGCRPVAAEPALVPRLGLERAGRRAEVWVGQVLAWRHAGLSARLQLDMSAQAAPTALSARTQLAAGLWWQPGRDLAMGLRLGGRRDDDGDLDQQFSVTGVWRPIDGGLLFTRWQGEGDGDDALREVGLRWWLLPRRVSLEMSWPTDPAHTDAEGRLRLSWRGLRL